MRILKGGEASELLESIKEVGFCEENCEAEVRVSGIFFIPSKGMSLEQIEQAVDYSHASILQTSTLGKKCKKTQQEIKEITVAGFDMIKWHNLPTGRGPYSVSKAVLKSGDKIELKFVAESKFEKRIKCRW